MEKRSSLNLTPNAKGEVVDRQCPECGAWASEHEVIYQTRITAGIHTLAEMRAMSPAVHGDAVWGNDFLKCPR